MEVMHPGTARCAAQTARDTDVTHKKTLSGGIRFCFCPKVPHLSVCTLNAVAISLNYRPVGLDSEPLFRRLLKLRLAIVGCQSDFD
jgi:hypothetical protein